MCQNLNFKFYKYYFSTCGKSRCGEAKKFELEFKGQEINKIGKSTSGEAKKFEFEFGKK